MKFIEYVKTAFTNIGVFDILEILIIASILYAIFSYILKKKANWYANFMVLCIMAFFAIGAFLVKFNVTEIIILLSVLVLSTMIIFAREIERDLYRLSWRKFKFSSEKRIQMSKEAVDDSINKIVKASQDMSKQDIGALMIIAPDNISNYILESGTVLNAKLSSELLETIFFPKSPLHDGAVVIKGDTVLAAGCYLPLTQETNLSKDLGTRHRAAIGITEVNPYVTAVIVSEETGIISVVYQGKIKRYLDTEMLRQALNCAFNMQDAAKLKEFWRLDNGE